MKKSLYIFLVLTIFFGKTMAQNKTIVDDLNTAKEGQGDIKVMQDETIQNIVGGYNEPKVLAPVAKNNSSPDTVKTNGTTNTTLSNSSSSDNVIKTRGYKIQVFMGNNQQQSRREAESKQAQIRSVYPDLDTEITFKSPFFRLRVGNFSSREEAQHMLNDMKKTFPSFGKEMIIVSDIVRRHSSY